MRPPLRCWRVYPHDPTAVPGAPFTATWIHPGQTAGRFDLQNRPPVLYLAETAEHAVGEVLQGFRGRRIGPAHLRRHGHPLALVSVLLGDDLSTRLSDLTDPATLALFGIRPDALASHERRTTQAIARELHARGEPGFRWWSSLTGAWHGVVLFADRLGGADLAIGDPETLAIDHPAVATAAALLGIARA
ncbi:MAG TPA: RES family NAD+ phosphorylase [Gemmatimonadales bacterium]|nr:RES family NAD+ phosphorylase [Gemmatimonadales bacterium]